MEGLLSTGPTPSSLYSLYDMVVLKVSFVEVYEGLRCPEGDNNMIHSPNLPYSEGIDSHAAAIPLLKVV